MLYRLCTFLPIFKIYVVEGPRACLVDEEVSLGRFLERRRIRLPVQSKECFWLAVGGFVLDICQKAGTSV